MSPLPTMTRLPSESFWPSGTIDTDMRLPLPGLGSSDSSSVISPLALPRGAAGYFDHVSVNGNNLSQLAAAAHNPSKNAAPGASRRSQVNSPLSPGVRGPALSHVPQFLSPHLLPVGREAQYNLQQHRSTSLPPTRREPRSSTGKPKTTIIISQLGAPAVPGSLQGSTENLKPVNGAVNSSNAPMSAIGSTSAAHPRRTSTDSASAPSQVQTIRRLVQQNGRIREAWEAERKYLEANRERAEEVYKEERALMEDERVEWETEKVGLLQEIERLQHQILSLGGDPRFARDGSVSNAKINFVSSHNMRGGAIWETSPESMRSSHSSQGSAQREGRTELERPSRGTLGPLSFRQTTGFSTEPTTNDSLTPIVDVQEIHPDLEGIPIKSNTIQKPTFKDTPSRSESQASSRASSPSNKAATTSQGPKEQTLQVLAADESDRLTMHAGHTPSHSLSLLPTMSSSGAATATSSGDSTPTLHQGDGVAAEELPAGDASSGVPSHPAEPFPSLATAQNNFSEDHLEPIYEASEDRELKGPLMVRNMPAHDEIFFRRLSDKLEEVSKDTMAALPAVLRGVDSACDKVEEPKSENTSNAKSDAQQEVVASKDQSSPKSGEEEELDIPLKIKRSFNFGAPFGEFR
ncbi:hypothetical protein B0T26DRAFT_647930 [Lasiosphaeria miniovina]|uniref:Uncharacterized protein n=1 Tax=Lasiosphaeria miniovina TaxID=1954250 RepID=A0AA40DUT1_9PEZI|nr:uncharacterized protein B0T26DRAFT_647930 [Lasiosphaeria miniovina]KAK0717184.1 hypothetical protein B0T26DRAFT_647930 [Lasiosphaeria miniovina]